MAKKVIGIKYNEVYSQIQSLQRIVEDDVIGISKKTEQNLLDGLSSASGETKETAVSFGNETHYLAKELGAELQLLLEFLEHSARQFESQDSSLAINVKSGGKR